MTLVDDHWEHEEVDLAAPDTRPTGRWNSAGVPGERSRDFRTALRRLTDMLGRNWIVLVVVVFLAVASAAFNVAGPKILGHGTDLIVTGVVSGQGIDFGALHHTLLQALMVYAASSALSIVASYLLAGVIQ